MPTGTLRRLLAKLGLGLCAAMFACAALAGTPAKKSPTWSELNPEQQQILKPLAGEWDKLDAVRRAKWLGIAKRYHKMTPTGQKRVQKRMAAWVKLTPDERRNAREQYRKIGRLPPDKREVVSKQWAEYQQLPADEKKRLAAEHQQKKKGAKAESSKRVKAAKAVPPPPSPVPPVPAPTAVSAVQAVPAAAPTEPAAAPAPAR